MLRVTFNLDPSTHGSTRENRPIELPDKEDSITERDVDCHRRPVQQARKEKHFAIRASDLINQLEKEKSSGSVVVERQESPRKTRENQEGFVRTSPVIAPKLDTAQLVPSHKHETQNPYSLKSILGQIKSFLSFSKQDPQQTRLSQD